MFLDLMYNLMTAMIILAPFIFSLITAFTIGMIFLLGLATLVKMIGNVIFNKRKKIK